MLGDENEPGRCSWTFILILAALGYTWCLFKGLGLLQLVCLCNAMLWYVMLWHAMVCYIILRYAMQCYDMLCCVVLRQRCRALQCNEFYFNACACARARACAYAATPVCYALCFRGRAHVHVCALCREHIYVSAVATKTFNFHAVILQAAPRPSACVVFHCVVFHCVVFQWRSGAEGSAIGVAPTTFSNGVGHTGAAAATAARTAIWG